MQQDRQEIQQFLRKACHDLRTHLRSVRANSELLLRNPELGGEEHKQVLGFVIDGAAGANTLVEAISNYAAALEIRPNPAPISSGMLLRNALAKLAKDISASGAEVTYGDLPSVEGDPDRLLQLFENLVRNAVDHRGEQSPRIHVDATRQNGNWLFSVRDNGPGIDPDDLERIFRPFERASRERPGLGLAICRGIVEAHSGTISVANRSDGGACFTMRLPIVAGNPTARMEGAA